MRSAAITLLLSLGLPATALAGTAEFGIINGEAYTSDQFPATAQLIMRGELEGMGPVVAPMCTATLVAPDVVLTAGHCLDEYAITMGFMELTNMSFCVTFEEDLTWMNDEQYQGNPPLPDDAVCSAGFLQHPNFDLQSMTAVDGPAQFDDLSLVFLEEEIHDRPHAWLPDRDEGDELAEGTDVVIVGYGQRTAEQSDPWNPDPQAANIRYGGETIINELAEFEMQVGSDSDSTRKCHGDSGGPTFAEVGLEGEDLWRVIGVTSRAYNDTDDCQIGGIDVRVDAYLDWIDAEMRKACEDGVRSFCDDPGILRPEPVVAGDDDDASGDDDDDQSGAGCKNSIAGGSGGGLLALGLFGVVARRRR